MKSLKIISDPEAFQLLGDETRRKIVFLLRVKEMTVSQISAELNVTPQAVYHHIKKLQTAEMIEVAREERVGHLIESFYRTTAEVFICSVGNASSNPEFAKEQMKNVLNALQRLGFNLKYDEDKVSQLVDLQRDLQECCGAQKFEEALSELNDVDFVTKQMVLEYAELLSSSKKEFNEQQELKKKFKDLLISLINKENQ
jgi:predicted transcriptional regulator